MHITDKQIVQRRFSRTLETYNRQAFVQQQIASKLAGLLLNFNRKHFKRVLEIGCGTGFLTQKILSNSSVGEYMLNDLVDSAFKEVRQVTAGLNFGKYKFISGDAEATAFPNNIDAVFSSSSFQWFNNLESFISRMYGLLNSDGIIAFSTFGEDNFREIKTILNVGLNYKTLPEIVSFVKPGFDIIHTEEWWQQEQFQSPNTVLKHMKLTGVNGLKKSFFGKAKLLTFDAKYRQLFSNKDKSVNLTYHPIIIIAKKKQDERD